VQNGNTLPRFLLNLSLTARLLIATSSVLFFLAMYILLPKYIGFNTPLLFAVPVSLIAWMFRKAGLFLTLCVLFVTLWFYGTEQWGGFWPPPSQAVYFVVSASVLLFIGLLICGQRDAFDLADEAQYQIAVAYEQQQKLHEAKDQFLQNVNHELRTPLTAIYGYLELLLEHNVNLDNTMRATFLEHAMQSCDELQLLVNNVLDSMSEGKEKRKPIHMEQTAVMDVVHEVLERFDPKTTLEHHIVVHVPDYVAVMANPQYVRQVLRNLLSNAFKYAPVKTPIEISAKLYGLVVEPTHPAPEICISVKDAGPGIPADEIPLLFNQFVRLRRDTSGKVRGSGLGLYLSKQFVELMGGRIWVESEGIAGRGSRFNFTLPCVPNPTIKGQVENYELYVPTSLEEPSPEMSVETEEPSSSDSQGGKTAPLDVSRVNASPIGLVRTESFSVDSSPAS
jgi:signal transduction histidine kinase